MTNKPEEIKRCGYVSIIGQPNVGKSTLLNRILGKKISIVSHKAQTTRHQILGIKTRGSLQAIYVDTPGIQTAYTAKRLLDKYMNRLAYDMTSGVDVIIFMVDARQWTPADDHILGVLKKVECPVILVLNKIDLLPDRRQLLPLIKELSQKMSFAHIIPLSVLKNFNIDRLEVEIESYLSPSEHVFEGDRVTDRDDNFLIAEMIREKMLNRLHEEVPYGATVFVESTEEKRNGILGINAVIWVEREGQKAIVIGDKGKVLKVIGTQARLELEKLLNRKIFLSLWVKVKKNWSDDERLLKELGFS
jgi:GTPase